MRCEERHLQYMSNKPKLSKRVKQTNIIVYLICSK